MECIHSQKEPMLDKGRLRCIDCCSDLHHTLQSTCSEVGTAHFHCCPGSEHLGSLGFHRNFCNRTYHLCYTSRIRHQRTLSALTDCSRTRRGRSGTWIPMDKNRKDHSSICNPQSQSMASPWNKTPWCVHPTSPWCNRVGCLHNFSP